LFGLFWIAAFIIGCAQFIIAAAASTWYFSHNGDISGGKASLKMGFKWIFKHHLGSIAFGSLIIAIVQFIRAIFEYYRKTALKNKASENSVVKACLCVTSYCLYCLEKCVKFITKNAYILVAIQAKNFCRSAWTAFGLIISNILRFGAVTTLGCIFMFLGKLFIIIATCLICYGIIQQAAPVPDKISSPNFPLLCCAIIAYQIGSFFLSIFSFSIDTIFMCFLCDEQLAERGKGRPGNNRPKEMNAFMDRLENNKDKKGCCC